jgi:hypothetical protein
MMCFSPDGWSTITKNNPVLLNLSPQLFTHCFREVHPDVSQFLSSFDFVELAVDYWDLKFGVHLLGSFSVKRKNKKNF